MRPPPPPPRRRPPYHRLCSPLPPPPLADEQGKHVDRLFTIVYLPTNLAVLAAMIHWHANIRPKLRIVGGLSGFTLAMLGVPLVRRALLMRRRH